MPPTPGALRHGAVSRSIARPGSRAISCSNLCATPKNVRVCRRQGPHSPRQLHCCASAPAESSANALTLAAAERDIPRVSVVRGTAKIFKAGSPIVYEKSVGRIEGRRPKVADVVALTDGRMEAFAWGIYNPKSHYRVRILELDSESSRTSRTWDAFDVDSLLSHRLAAAVARRAALGLPSTDTDVFRLVNSEGDRVSGLVVDRLGDALVAVPSAAYVQRRRPLVEETLRRLTGISDVIWRPAEDMLRQEGLSDEEIGAASLEAETEKTAAQREVREGGLRYLVEPWGQKTGFYADQRESRAFIRPLCTGKRVLDLCCYSGGFALNAAAGGAIECTGVDSSASAVSLAKANAELNGLADRARFVCSDIEKFMAQALSDGLTWDVVILDPPKLAPSKGTLPKAERKYAKLNRSAAKLVAPGGILMTCSCSGAMTQSGSFTSVSCAAVESAGRQATVVRHAGAASDHVLSPWYPEGNYLTNLTLLLD